MRSLLPPESCRPAFRPGPWTRGLFLLCGLLCISASEELGAAAAPDHTPLAARIGALFAPVHADTPGASVLVARDGAVLFEQGFGSANLEAARAISPKTRFRIGSISKEFTAAAILKLMEEGRLGLHDPLARYLPDWPRGDQITIYHLLSHSSGIANYTARPGFEQAATTPIALEALLESFKNAPADFPPGAKYRYDNSGYALLAWIVEKVSGTSYEDFLRRTFFTPLGMDDTGVWPAEGPPADAAAGYGFDHGKIRPAPPWHRDRLAGCGALYSTARDLFRWNEALFNGRVLSEPTLRQAFSVAVLDLDDPAHPEETGYGLGWIIDRLRGEKEISHGGELPGFGSYLLRLPEKRLTVVVLLNCVPQQPGLHQWNLARDIAAQALAGELPPASRPQADPTVPVEALELTVGRYDLGDGAILSVTREDRQVYAEISGRPKMSLFPRTDRIFFVNAGEAEATFVRDAGGRVVKAILKQGGDRIDAPRLP